MIPSPCKACPKHNQTCKTGCNRWKFYEVCHKWDLERNRQKADKTAFGIDVRAKVARINLKKSYQN